MKLIAPACKKRDGESGKGPSLSRGERGYGGVDGRIAQKLTESAVACLKFAGCFIFSLTLTDNDCDNAANVQSSN